MTTTLTICMMWIVVIGGMYVFANVTFWIFAQLFGIIDRFIQG